MMLDVCLKHASVEANLLGFFDDRQLEESLNG